MTRRTSSQASASKIAAADRAERKPKRVIHRTDVEGGEALLAMPQAWPDRSPGPVVVPRFVNGRPLAGWERVLYREWAVRVRRAELALFDGLLS